MCEFCLYPNGNNSNDPDADHVDFAGFFSADAIEAAVRQANATREQSHDGGDDDASGEQEEDDDDGT